MKVAVVGLGPVGGVLAAQLARAGHEVIGIDVLESHLESIRRGGMRLEGVLTAAAPLDRLAPSPEGLVDASVEVVFFCLKANVGARVAAAYAGLIGEQTCVVSWQNGIDSERGIAERLGRERTLRGVVNYAGVLVEPGRVEVTFFHPPNFLGALGPGGAGQAARIARALTEAGLVTEATDDIAWHVWKKTILNSALSPVCALTGLNMKEAMAHEATHALVEAILDEAIAVAAAVGHRYDPEFRGACVTYLTGAGAHKPSLCFDLEQGVQTEIGFMNAKIVEHGARQAVPVPVNRAVTALLLGAEEANRARARAPS
jgi:2-dehydropantoate 2-reductase